MDVYRFEGYAEFLRMSLCLIARIGKRLFPSSLQVLFNWNLKNDGLVNVILPENPLVAL